MDDDDGKANSIDTLIRRNSYHSSIVTVARVASLADAARILGSTEFDLIVLDLLLPYFQRGPASSAAGLELLRQVRSPGGPNGSAQIVGLSAYPEELESSRTVFDAAGVLILNYQEDSWKAALTTIVRGLAGRGAPQIDVDFLVVCALEEERSGFAGIVQETSRAIVSDLNVQFVKDNFGRSLTGALVRLSEMGLVAAVRETAVALTQFRTDVVFATGICAGFSRHVNLGQVVVASPAWEYQAGKWSENGFEIAPKQVSIPPRTRVLIDHVLSDPVLMQRLEVGVEPGCPRPVVQSQPILAPFASGSAVIADAARLAHVEQQHRKVSALDMEVFGVYYAAHYHPLPPKHYFAAKCVVDFADSAKSDDLHRYGCVAAASAGIQIMRRLRADADQP